MAILIIEDDEGVRESIAEMLRDEGYDVDVVPDGERAIEYLGCRSPPTLILLDLLMPTMDGAQFCARQRANSEWARIPVVVMSARRDTAERARSIGAAAWLTKPMHFEELLHVIQNRAVTAGSGGVVTGVVMHESSPGESGPH